MKTRFLPDGLTLTRYVMAGVVLTGLVYACYRLYAGNLVVPSLAALGLWVACFVLGLFVLKRWASPTVSVTLILAGAVIIRFLFFQLLNDGYSIADAWHNTALASSVASGEGLDFYDPHTKLVFHALYPPVLPLLIAGLMRLGLDTPLGFWGMNVGFDLLSILLLVRLARTLGAPMAGHLAAWCFAVWPPFVALSIVVQKESLATLELMVILMLLSSLYQSFHIRWSIAAALGLASGLLALTQPAMALFPGLAALFLFWRRGVRYLLELGLKVAPFALLLLMPWWVRNWLVLGSFVPLTTTMGYGIWIASHAGATGMYAPLPSALAHGGEVATGARLATAGVEWLMQHPLEWLRITMIKVVKALSREDFFPFIAGPNAPFGANGFQNIRQFVFQAAHTGLVAYCAIGAKRLKASPLFPPMRLIFAAACVSLIFSAIPFEFAERHRYILVLLLFLMAGVVMAPPARANLEMQRPTIG